MCLCLVLFLVCLYICVCVRLQVQGPLRECRSIRPGASGLSYYCTPLVCIPAVFGLLAVWRHSKPGGPKNKNHPKTNQKPKINPSTPQSVHTLRSIKQSNTHMLKRWSPAHAKGGGN